MKFTLFAFLAAIVCMIGMQIVIAAPATTTTSSYTSAAEIVQGFDDMAQTIQRLLDSSSGSDGTTYSAPPLSFKGPEKDLLLLAQQQDRTAYRLAAFEGYLDEDSTQQISKDLMSSVDGVRKITQQIIQYAEIFKQQGVAELTVTILQSLAPGFDLLYQRLAEHLYANARKTVAPMLLDIICMMDDAAEALQPGVKFTDQEMCNTYGTYNNPNPDYDACPDRQWPSWPKMPEHYMTCDQSAGNVIKFGYERDCYSSNGKWACVSMTWCSSMSDGNTFEQCPYGWTPQKWQSN